MKRLIADRRGATAMVVALSIVPLVAAAGIAIDSGRGYLVKNRLSEAIDAAGLAAAREEDPTDQEADLEMYFWANFRQGFMQAVVDGPNLVREDDGRRLIVTASAEVPTTFMRVLGFETMTVGARAVVQQSTKGMELVLVMDNTGSMRSGGKITAMKEAALDLVDILYGVDDDGTPRETVEDFWVGLAPYTATVNVGPQHTAWLQDPTLAGYDYTSSSWKGCVEARSASGRDVTDDPPSAERWRPYYWVSTGPTDTHYSDNQYYCDNYWIRTTAPNKWPDISGNSNTKSDLCKSKRLKQFDRIVPYTLPNRWYAFNEQDTDENDGTGPNLGCGPAVTPMVAERSAVRAAITEMAPWHRGGTATNIGLVWGWRMLSPRWRGLWDGSARPLDYHTALMDKVVVILTDGDNATYDGADGGYIVDYTSYGRLEEGRLGTTSSSVAKSRLDERMSQICTAMKAEGIILYTITFQVSSSTARDLFRTCATTPNHYFNAPTNAELGTVFERIAGQLNNLRLAE